MNFKEHFHLYEALDKTNIYTRTIAKYLFGDEKRVDDIPLPHGKYQVGVDFQVDPKDLDTFTKLFPITPPKEGEELDSAGTKGSGNGEIALYWLFSKDHTVQDMRGGDNPDLLIDNTKIEVKAYDSRRFGLGRFGNQASNRQLLSVVFGLKALLNSIRPSDVAERQPSLDDFNKQEVIDSFKVLQDFDNNQELRKVASAYPLIDMIYKQIDSVLAGLGLVTGKFTAEDGAAAMLRMLLITKLDKKPGDNGYIINIAYKKKLKNFQGTFFKVSIKNIKKLNTENILNGVQASGAALKIDPYLLFK